MTRGEWTPGEMRTGEDYFPLTVGELRAAIANLDDDVELDFSVATDGKGLRFYRFKRRGDNLLQIELTEFE